MEGKGGERQRERERGGGGGGEDGKGNNYMTDQYRFSQGPLVDLSWIVEL